MKNIMVISDTHGNIEIFNRLTPQFVDADFIFHLGDVASDAQYLKERFGSKVISVLGNCDGDIIGDEKIVKVENVTFLLTHGHSFSVKTTLDFLYNEGIAKKVDYCLFGHTHEATVEKYTNLTLINPGTLSNRASENSYLFMTVVNDKCFYKMVKIN